MIHNAHDNNEEVDPGNALDVIKRAFDEQKTH